MCVVYILSPVDGIMSDLEAVKILPHKNSKLHNKPYIRTSKDVFEEADLLLGSSQSASTAYDECLSRSGGSFTSSSQSQEPRDIQQIYRRKSNLKKKGLN